jgi:hypothetical protein
MGDQSEARLRRHHLKVGVEGVHCGLVSVKVFRKKRRSNLDQT